MHPMLNIAVKAARRAGSIINRAALDRTKLEIRAKRANDFVTQVDKAAEAAIIDIIRQAYPDHAILGEESGATPGKGAEGRIPLDHRSAGRHHQLHPRLPAVLRFDRACSTAARSRTA